LVQCAAPVLRRMVHARAMERLTMAAAEGRRRGVGLPDFCPIQAGCCSTLWKEPGDGSSRAQTSRSSRSPGSQSVKAYPGLANHMDELEMVGAALQSGSAYHEVDIPEDAYGAAILAIVRDFQEVYAGIDVWLNLLTGSFVLVVNMVNLFLQFAVVGYLQKMVVEPKVHMVQEAYRHFHSHVFDSQGHFGYDSWHKYERQQEICQIAMTNPGFYVTSLFLWWASMLQEFRTTWRLFFVIRGMPRCERGLDMLGAVQPEGEEDQPPGPAPVHVVALTTTVRIILWLLVCIPKFIICLALLWSGSEWLSATNAFEDLIMNAVAMTFVTHIDELLYEVLVPIKYREEVSAINFMMPGRCDNAKEARNEEMWKGFRRSAVYVGFILAGIFLYSEIFQDVLPHDVGDLRKHCKEYMTQVSPICTTGFLERIKSIVSRGSIQRKCYPYGPQIDDHVGLFR